jgi:hypothetical protein
LRTVPCRHAQDHGEEGQERRLGWVSVAVLDGHEALAEFGFVDDEGEPVH